MDYLYTILPQDSLPEAERLLAELKASANPNEFAGGKVWPATPEISLRIVLFFRLPADYDSEKWPKQMRRMSVADCDKAYWGIEC